MTRTGVYYLATGSNWRSPRLQCASATPAVLRFQSGRRVRANLQVISVTGGLLNMSAPVDRGALLKLMFFTGAGTVLGTVEMLPSLNNRQQPFRFVTLDQDDECRLRNVIQKSVDQKRREQGAIVRDRTW